MLADLHYHHHIMKKKKKNEEVIRNWESKKESEK